MQKNMNKLVRWCYRGACLSLLWAVFPSASLAEVPLSTAITRALDAGMVSFMEPQEKAILHQFYSSRQFAPVWVTPSGLTQQAKTVVEMINGADHEGLNPEHYHTQDIPSLLKQDTLGSQAIAEVTISYAVMRYSHDLRYGRYNPGKPALSADFLGRAAATPGAVYPLFVALPPGTAEYVKLKRVLAEYRKIAEKGGWPSIPPYMLLQKGDKAPQVRDLKKILGTMGDLAVNDGTDVFDDSVVTAVKAFQKRHGLEQDGAVGRFTREEINTPVEYRVRQIMMSMERMRWFPRQPGNRYAVINIPAYELTAVENGEEVLGMRVILGRQARQTPTMSRTISHVIFNPPWSVPSRIASEDLLPKIKKHPEIFDVNGFQLLQYVGGKEIEVDPRSVNWDAMGADQFNRFVMRQEPGAINPLGKVKFQIPDSSFVYLHDTPEKQLFKRYDRAFSSGCIRLEKPEKFAQFVLKGQSGWSDAKVTETFATKKGTWHVAVSHPVKVHVVYWSSWVDKEGKINFGFDIYKKDQVLASMMYPTGKRVAIEISSGIDQPY